MRKQSPKIARARATKLYAKLVRSTTKYSKKNGLEWDVDEVRKFVSKNVYPKFKGLSKSKVLVRDINAQIENVLNAPTPVVPQEPKGNYFNPLLVPPSSTSGILWFDIDDYLSVDLLGEVTPLDLRVEVNGGEYGNTDIFDLSSYEYFSVGIHDIIENIRAVLDNDSEPEWVGVPVVRQGFSDDGDADSYFLRFTLYVNGQEVPPTEPLEVSTKEIPVTTETLEERRAKRKQVTLRKKELAKIRRTKEKEKEARKRPRPTKKETPTKLTQKDQKERSKNIAQAMEREKELLADSERLYREGILTKKEFIAERKEIMETTRLAISKFEKGGEV